MFSSIGVVLFTCLVQLAEPQSSSVPGDEVIATLGQPVLINCHLNRPLDPNVIRIYWQGRKTSDVMDEFPEVLHAYNKGMEEFDKQNSHYQNRTAIYRDLIYQGNLSLLISEAKAEDDNTQLIVHVQENIVHNICRKMLRVSARFQKPEINVSCMESVGELKLVCTSHGGFPEPKVNWTGLNHQDNNPPPTVTFNLNENTYSVSSTLWVNLTKDQSVTCHVTNPTSQETIYTSITPRDSCPGMYLSGHTTTVIICISVPFIVGIVGILLYKRNQRCGELRAPTSDPDEEKGLQDEKGHTCCDT